MMDETELFEEIHSFIAGEILEGFRTDDEIIESAVESFEDETGRDDLQPEIERIVAELSASHHAQQVGWESRTDCDRLDEAFVTLENQGIVARQNFSCCSNCGHAEIGNEIQQTKAKRDVLGYTFYHMQDTERATGGSLYLAFGAVKPGPEPIIHVGRAIVEILRQAGLKTEWDENPNNRILITDLDWKRRRP